MPQLRHRRLIELVYLAQGMQFRAHSGSNHPMHAGQCLVIPAGARHGSGVMPRLPGIAHWLQVTIEGPLLGLPEAEAEAVRAALAAAPPEPFPVPDAWREHWRALGALATHRRPSPAQTVAMRRHLLAILVDAGTAGHHALAAPRPDRLASRVVDLLRRDPVLAGQPAVLAQHVGLSYSRLRARIKAATGQALGDWLMRLRIHAAMERIIAEPRRPITDIALDLGFSSSQYFATCFRRYAAMSASRFRAEAATDTGRRRIARIRDAVA